jgi:hypothetical protein
LIPVPVNEYFNVFAIGYFFTIKMLFISYVAKNLDHDPSHKSGYGSELNGPDPTGSGSATPISGTVPLQVVNVTMHSSQYHIIMGF